MWRSKCNKNMFNSLLLPSGLRDETLAARLAASALTYSYFAA